MELTKEKARENLTKLIEKFERESSLERIQDYTEEAMKLGFINPLLKDVLGWDVENFDVVSPEKRVSRGRVDYGLKVGGKIKVFIEAKAAKDALTNKDIEQAVGYGYSYRGVPFVILTNFAELKLFDVTVKPDRRNPFKGLKMDLRWNQYLQDFERLWLLSKEAVSQGELDKLHLAKPKERLPLDKGILDDFKKWRENLAKDIFKRNPRLFHSGDTAKDADYLKEITQRILDRIIFIRSCEDRGLVFWRPLKDVFEEKTETVGTNTMVFLRPEFGFYNSHFDSDLFRPQEWENDLAIDFKVMRDIVLDTYNPYQFDVIPVEVLGNIYEQYLGYTIRLTDHQVKYELKPEVRKAGGVYYTPEYIVDYIVMNTVGRLLKELPPRKIRKLRILDPACGSGSFLIRAYEEMLKWCEDQKKHQRKIRSEEGKLYPGYEEQEPRLTIREKSEILCQHIFGVDIDKQAVEVTKLSLMLKMLEGEHKIIPGKGLLPMLNKNIKCGNSLISGSPLELKKYFGDTWYKAKPFNWNEEFRKIMVEEGGFDVVLGNPPYLSFSGRQKPKGYEKEIAYWKERYPWDAWPSSHGLFLIRGIEILRRGGLLSYIVPDQVGHLAGYGPLRSELSRRKGIHEVKYWGEKVFLGVTTPTLTVLIGDPCKTTKVIEKDGKITQVKLSKEAPWVFSKNYLLIKKICSRGISLGNSIGDPGVHTGNCSEILILDKDGARGLKAAPILEGKKISRYKCEKPTKFLRLDYLPKEGEYFTIRPLEIYKRVQFVIRQTAGYPIVARKEGAEYFRNSLLALYPWPPHDLRYVVGILNSSLIRFFYSQTVIEAGQKAFPQVKVRSLRTLPIRKIDFSNSAEKKLHDTLVALVNVMLDLNKKIQTAKGSEKDQIQRQIEKTDKEIDDLVYKLYGITEEERKTIELNYE